MTSSSLIDHTYINIKKNISDSGVLKLAVSDHSDIFVATKLNNIYKSGNKNSHTVINYYDWDKADDEKVAEALEKVQIDVTTDPNKMCNDFNVKLKQIIQTNIPLRQKRVRHDIKEKWMSPEIFNSIRLRDNVK